MEAEIFISFNDQQLAGVVEARPYAADAGLYGFASS